jgi:hypothetical protein
VLEDAAVRLEFCARLQGDDEMFVTQAHQLGKVTGARDGGIGGYGHENILPYPFSL